MVRHIALNLIRLDTSHKASIKTKPLLAATSNEFRAELLGFDPDGEEETTNDVCVAAGALANPPPLKHT